MLDWNEGFKKDYFKIIKNVRLIVATERKEFTQSVNSFLSVATINDWNRKNLEENYSGQLLELYI